MKLNVNDAIEHTKRDIFGILNDVYVSLTISGIKKMNKVFPLVKTNHVYKEKSTSFFFDQTNFF